MHCQQQILMSNMRACSKSAFSEACAKRMRAPLQSEQISHNDREQECSKGVMSKKITPKSPSELRLIAGKFRSRKIIFFEEEGLRPTHNRIRETLFNWLANSIENKVCLDLFSGSGALGFEALSRGAKHVTFCDISKNVIRTLKENASTLEISNADFLCGDFILQNMVQNKKYDVVFLDPPFKKNILLTACELLESRDLLNSGAFIYLEFEKNSVDLSLLPKNWVVKKRKDTQTIEYVLCERR